MKIVISSGHGKYVRGASGYLDEVNEARRVVERVADFLGNADVTVTTYHDDVSTSQNENLNRIVDFHNSKSRDLDVSVHFNAYQTTSKPMGTECLYVTQSDLAGQVAAAVADAGHFLDRGPKKRTDLFFLNNTEMPAILIETCFVDSKADADLYNQNFDAVCEAIAGAISGEEIGDAPPERPDRPERPPIFEQPPPSSRPMLKNGSSGSDVTDLQELLGNVTVDGHFGNETEASVRSYQMSRDLEVDGYVGDETWAALESDMPPSRPVLEPLTEVTMTAIAAEAADSDLAGVSWKDRGTAPAGYINGMAIVYGQVYERFKWGDSAALKMGSKVTRNDKDALWVYFEEERPAGVATLRKLFVLQIGLGMRESSGQYNEGRDMSASNVTADTAESGLFQQSWNSHTASSEIENLLSRYLDEPELGLEPVFKEEVSPKSMNVYGSGKGAQFQAMAIQCPAFAAEAAAVCLRVLCNHFGPINRHEAEVRDEADELLRRVEEIVDHQPREEEMA